MGRKHIIRRTARIRTLQEMLSKNRIVFLSSFFYSGKTVLLNQLLNRLNGMTLRFDAEKDDWSAFESSAGEFSEGTLIFQISGLKPPPFRR